MSMKLSGIKALLFLSVSLLTVACKNGTEGYDTNGTVEAIGLTVSAQANGNILDLDVQEGQNVSAGDILGHIDSTQLFLQKQLLLAGKKARSEQRPDAQKQMAATRIALSQARSELDRVEKLYREGVSTEQQYSQAKSTVAQLEASIEAQEALLSGNIGSIDAESHAQDLQVAQVEDMLEKCKIVSPIDGIVIEKYAYKGEQAYMGRPLLKIADLSNMTLKVYVSAERLSSLRIGQDVTVFVLRNKETISYPGRISHISEQAEFTPKSLQTQDERANLVYAVKISIQNDGYLKIGMYADVKF